MLLDKYMSNRRILLLKLQREKEKRKSIDKKINNIIAELKNWDKVLLYEED